MSIYSMKSIYTLILIPFPFGSFFFLWIKSRIIWEHSPSKYSFRYWHLHALSAGSQPLPSTVWTEVNQRSREPSCQDYVVLSSFTAKNSHFLYDEIWTPQHTGLGTAGASDPLHPCSVSCRHSVLRGSDTHATSWLALLLPCLNKVLALALKHCCSEKPSLTETSILSIN